MEHHHHPGCPPWALPGSRTPLLCWQNVVSAALTLALLPTHGQHGKPLTTHAAYMCFSCLHVYSLIAVHKPARGRVIQKALGCIMSVSHTLRKYSSQWLLVLRALSIIHSCCQSCSTNAAIAVTTWNKNTSQPGDSQKHKVEEKMFLYYLMLWNSFWWQFCLAPSAPRTARKVELFSLDSWRHGIIGLFTSEKGWPTSEKGWPWRKQNIRCCLGQQESSLHFKCTAD